MNIKPRIRHVNFFPIILFFFAFLLRLALIGKGPYHPDTLMLVEQSRETLATGILQPYLTGYNLPVLLGALFIKIFQWLGWGDPFRAVNFISVLFGALCVPVFYSFCRKLLDARTAFFSSMLLSTLPLFLSISTFGSSQIPALFFLFLGLSWLMDIPQSRRGWWGSVISFGLAGACRPQDVAFMLVPISYLYLMQTSSKETSILISPTQQQWSDLLKFWGFVLFVVFLIPLPFVLPDKNHSLVESFRNLYKAYASTHFNSVKDIFPMFRFSAWVIFAELTFLVFSTAIYGFILLWKKSPRIGAFVLMSLVFPYVLYTCAMFSIMPTSRYLLLCLPAFLIASGYAFASLFDVAAKISMSICFIGFCVVHLGYFSDIMPALIHRHQYSTSTELARWVARRTEPDAVIIVSDEADFMTKWGHRKIFTWPFNENENYKQSISDLVRRVPVYILVPQDKDFLRDYGFLLPFLRKNYNLKYMGSSFVEWWAHSTTRLQLFPEILLKIEPLAT